MNCKNCILGISLFLLMVWAAPVWAADISGAKDHPLISRYKGSEITHYDVAKYEKYPVILGPFNVNKNDYEKKMEVEGRITRLAYVAPPEATSLEIFRNFEVALKKAEFEILYQNEKTSSLYTNLYSPLMPQRLFWRDPKSDAHYFNMISNEGKYLAAKRTKDSQEVYIVLGVAESKPWIGKIAYALDIVEIEKMETGKVEVNAEYIKQKMDSEGKIALYGIHFDHDKDVIKSESQKTLDAMAKYLKANPEVKVYVTGHTDAIGTYEYNLDLSTQRARAVVSALTSQYKISTKRLYAIGIGPAAPVATNENEAGKALNRRVELVKRLK